MSPITDLQRLKEIQKRSAELWRIAALPRYDPQTGVENPWVVTTQADQDVRFLLSQVASLQDEIFRLEELLDENDTIDEDPDDAA